MKPKKILHKAICYFNVHKWEYKFEEVVTKELINFYGQKYITAATPKPVTEIGFPSMVFYKDNSGAMISLNPRPSGMIEFPDDFFYRKIRICNHCYKKQEYCRKILDLGLFPKREQKEWRTIELSRDDIRDRTLKTVLEWEVN